MAEEESQAQPEAVETTTEAADSFLTKVVEVTSEDRDKSAAWLGPVIERLPSGRHKSVTATLKKMIEDVDQEMSRQLAAVMHAEEFLQLEGTWRGFHYLVHSSETCETLKIKALNATKRELYKDLTDAIEFDQSLLFKKIYENEFGMPGGAPFGSLVGDFYFENHPEDIEFLQKISEVAAAAFCPFITGTAPKLFGYDTWTKLNTTRDLGSVFDTEDYAKWRSFRETEDSRYVVMTFPRVLARLPYGTNNKTIDEFEYNEVPLDDKGRDLEHDHEHYCWMNCAWGLGAILTGAFARTNWCTAIRGYENGGLIENLPAHLYVGKRGGKEIKCPTEVLIPDRRDAEISKLGFMALCNYKNTDKSVFFGGQTTQKAKKYDKASATENAAISARLPYIMASSRIAHFLKMIARDKIGAFMEATDCEDWLTRWINQYILADAKADAEKKARFPLAEAKIEVRTIPGKPGAYAADVRMRPWLQLEELNAAVGMVTEIPRE